MVDPFELLLIKIERKFVGAVHHISMYQHRLIVFMVI